MKTATMSLNNLLKEGNISLNKEMGTILKNSEILEIDSTIESEIITQEFYRIPGQQNPDSILQRKTGEKILNKTQMISVLVLLLTQNEKNDVFLLHCEIGFLKTKYTILVKNGKIEACPFNTEKLGVSHGTMVYLK